MDFNYLEGYVKLQEGTEIPPSFALWCGLSTISIILERRVYVDMGIYTAYPNLFVVLIAGSGRCRKSTSIDVAADLVRSVDPPPKIIAQQMTKEALIETLKVSTGGSTVSQGFIIADEFTNFLSKQAFEDGLGTLLIPLYDCKSVYEYRTRKHGTETLNECCLGLLGASTPDLLRKAVPESAVGGGLTSRILFIYEDIAPPPQPRPTFSKEKRDILSELQKCLCRYRSISGEVILSDEAWKTWDGLYRKFYVSKLYDDPSLSGYASRRGVHLLKISMILSIIDNEKKIIEPRHLLAGDTLLSDLERDLPSVIKLLTSTDGGDIAVMIMGEIRKRKKVSRSDLLRLFAHKISAKEFKDVIETLYASNQITIEPINGTSYYIALD